MCYLHSRTPVIVHGDLRGGNIMFSENGVPCLIDFGLSRVLGDINGMSTSGEVAGSLSWMSPELLENGKASVQSDVWAFGMTALEIITGRHPYHEARFKPTVLRLIMTSQIPSWRDSNELPGCLWTVFQLCWNQRPGHRPSMSEATSRLLAMYAGTT